MLQQVNTRSLQRSEGAQKTLAGRVLIADDAASSRDLLRSILEGCGFEVAEACDGEEALQRAFTFCPELIILDLRMPKLDGFATATALRRTSGFETKPILALTAAPTDAKPEDVMAAGFTATLMKPIGPARLRKCVSQLLEKTPCYPISKP